MSFTDVKIKYFTLDDASIDSFLVFLCRKVDRGIPFSLVN